jgi:hypothetical protein
MKHLLFLLVLILPPVAQATSVSRPAATTRSLSVPGPAYDIQFAIDWACDDYPLNSASGRAELYDDTGTLVGRVLASVNRNSGPSVTVTGLGTVEVGPWYATIYAPNGTPADAGLALTWHVTGLTPGTYTLKLTSYTTNDTLLHGSTVWTNTNFVGGSAPVNLAPDIAWTSSPGAVASGQPYTVTAHGHDPDGNLTQVNVWKDGVPFAFAGGGNGTDGDSGNPTSDTGPQSVTFTAQASDALGAASPVISFTVSIAAPPPALCTLATVAGAGGIVSPGGTYNAGTVVTVAATPDATHDFAGWSGDASGAANPLSITLDRNQGVQANFSLKLFPLTTNATSGGSVTPGGSYPYGTIVTLSATPDASSRFTGWTGDVTSGSTSIAVTMTAPHSVQAGFVPKQAQTIIFTNPGSRSSSAGPFALSGSATSGLTVTYTVLSGPAVMTGGQLQVTGPGAVIVQANQPGDATYLAAPPVTQTFNSVAPALVKFQPAARTLVQGLSVRTPANLILAQP